jgi:hypothetical protein
LNDFRSRSGALGRHVRAIVTGLSLLAAGAGAGKLAGEERQQQVVMDLSKKLGAEEAKNEALRQRLEEGKGGRMQEAEDSRFAAEKAERTEDKLRAKIEELQRTILAEKEKNLNLQAQVREMRQIAANYQALFEKMRSLVDASGNDELRKDAERFIEAME